MRFDRLLAVGAWLGACLVVVAVWVARPSWSPFLALLVAALLCVAAARGRPTRAAVTAALPRTATGAIVAALVGVSLVAAIMRTPGVVTAAYHALRAPQYSRTRADIQPLALYGSVDAVEAAARTIPAGATYSVVGGDKYDVWAMYRFWLAPRPFTGDYHDASWVIVNGEPAPRDLPRGRRVPLAPGIYALEVSR